MSNEDLRALAEKATRGEWEADGKIIYLGVKSRPDPEDNYNVTYWESTGTIYDEGGHTEADAAYIAAASPDRVIALLDENADLYARLVAQRREHGTWAERNEEAAEVRAALVDSKPAG